MKDARHLTPAEFEIMQVLWRGDRALSVAEVLAVVRLRKAVAYTTVMTLLDRMARKGSVSRAKRGKAYLYLPQVTRSAVLGFLIGDFTRSFCDGDREKLLSWLRGPPAAPGAGGEGRELEVELL